MAPDGFAAAAHRAMQEALRRRGRATGERVEAPATGGPVADPAPDRMPMFLGCHPLRWPVPEVPDAE